MILRHNTYVHTQNTHTARPLLALPLDPVPCPPWPPAGGRHARGYHHLQCGGEGGRPRQPGPLLWRLRHRRGAQPRRRHHPHQAALWLQEGEPSLQALPAVPDDSSPTERQPCASLPWLASCYPAARCWSASLATELDKLAVLGGAAWARSLGIGPQLCGCRAGGAAASASRAAKRAWPDLWNLLPARPACR